MLKDIDGLTPVLIHNSIRQFNLTIKEIEILKLKYRKIRVREFSQTAMEYLCDFLFESSENVGAFLSYLATQAVNFPLALAFDEKMPLGATDISHPGFEGQIATENNTPGFYN